MYGNSFHGDSALFGGARKSINSLRNYMKEFGTRGLHKSANFFLAWLSLGEAAEERKLVIVL